MRKWDKITIAIVGSLPVVVGLLIVVPDAISAVLAGSGLVALALLVTGVRRARAAGDLDASALLTLALGWLVSLPIAIAVVTGGVDRQLDLYRELAPVLPGWYQGAAHIGVALVAALAAMLLVRRLISDGSRTRVHVAALLAILLWAIAWLASGLHGDRLLSLSGVALLVVLMAAAVLPRGRGACVGVGIFGVTLALASSALSVVDFELATAPCGHTCVLGPAFAGVFPNQNMLGATLVATLPFAYLGFRGPAGALLALYLAAMALATGSRAAMIGSLVVVVALLVLRPRLEPTGPAPARTAIAGIGLLAAVAASAFVFLHDWGPGDELTDRPAIWGVAGEYIQESPVFGYGPVKWQSLYTETGEIPYAGQISTHNQWAEVLFTAGWVGLAVFIAMIAALLWSAGHARIGMLIALATTFLLGAGGAALLVGAVDQLSFSFVALILLAPPESGRASARGQSRPAPARSASWPFGPGRGTVEIGQYIDVLRARRALVVVSILACTAGAAVLAWTRPATYAVETQLFVSTSGLPGEAGQAFEGELYAQQRARSYAEIISSPRGAQAVIEQLGLSESVESVQDKIRATVPPNSVVINVTVRDRSAPLAMSIADALDDRVPRLAEDLERPEDSRRSPVQVTAAAPAQLPASPVSPRKPIYLALGALLGLALGIGGAVLRHALDRRIRDADAGAISGAPVLGRIAEHREEEPSPVMMGDPLSAGAEGYRALQVNLRALRAEHDLRSFVVSSAVAAEGKTDVVANLGIALAQARERVVVVDANLRSPRLGGLLGVRSSIGLTDFLETRGPIELALRRHPTAPLEVLPSGSPRPNPSELLDSEALDGVLQALREWFDFVIVDAPALLPVADGAIVARRASGVILVARAASTSTEELQAARQALRAVDARVLGVVLNRVPPPDSRPYRADPLPLRGGRSLTVAPIRSDGQGGSEWSR